MDKNLERLEKLFEVANQDFVTEDDFVIAIGLLKKSIDESDEEIKAIASDLIEKLQESKKEWKDTFKEEVSIIRDQLSLLRQSMDKVRAQKGDKGDPGKSIVGPQGPQGIPGKDGDIKELSPEELRDSLELLEGDERLDASAIKNLPSAVERVVERVGQGIGGVEVFNSTGIKIGSGTGLKFVGSGVSVSNSDGHVTTVTIPGGSGSSGTEVWGEVPSGSGTNFTLANTPTAGTVRLYRGGARQKVTDDYSITGASITLSPALQVGEVLIADYKY